jgi:hypothetical protein
MNALGLLRTTLQPRRRPLAIAMKQNGTILCQSVNADLDELPQE